MEVVIGLQGLWIDGERFEYGKVGMHLKCTWKGSVVLLQNTDVQYGLVSSASFSLLLVCVEVGV